MLNKIILVIVAGLVVVFAVLLVINFAFKPQPSLTACPEIAPACGAYKEECLTAAQNLEARYPGCSYQNICEQCEQQ